jgi:hypothetical protein
MRMYMTYEQVEVKVEDMWVSGQVREMFFVGGRMHYWVKVGGGWDDIRVAAVPANLR